MNAETDYAGRVRGAFADRVQGVYLYGSRARGDHRDDSDADIAVVLTDIDFWDDLFRLADLAYELNASGEIFIHPRPISLAEWLSESKPGSFIAEIKKDARELETVS